MSTSVTITGGGGFLGKTILRQCRERGWNVRALGRTPHPELVSEGVEFFPIDLSDSKKIPEITKIFSGSDLVLHTAAKAGVWWKYAEFECANLTGTKNVIEACKRAAIRNLVYTSTPSVTFNGNAICGGNESLPYYTGKLSSYAKTKAQAESLVRSTHSPELRTVSLRPHLIWGVGDPHLLPRVISQAAQMKLRIVGEGKNKVDLTHVENAAHAHLLAAEALLTDSEILCKSDYGKAYFVSDGAPVSLWSWINTFLEGVGVPVVTQKISFKAAYRAGTLLEFFWKVFGVAGEPPITRFVATELSHDHWFDISAIRQDLGYIPPVSNDTGMRELIAHFR
jgi:nucleoside-diphosphate-sugar epimerase